MLQNSVCKHCKNPGKGWRNSLDFRWWNTKMGISKVRKFLQVRFDSFWNDLKYELIAVNLHPETETCRSTKERIFTFLQPMRCAKVKRHQSNMARVSWFFAPRDRICCHLEKYEASVVYLLKISNVTSFSNDVCIYLLPTLCAAVKFTWCHRDTIPVSKNLVIVKCASMLKVAPVFHTCWSEIESFGDVHQMFQWWGIICQKNTIMIDVLLWTIMQLILNQLISWSLSFAVLGKGCPKGLCSELGALTCNFMFVLFYCENAFMNEMWHFIYLLSGLLNYYYY